MIRINTEQQSYWLSRPINPCPITDVTKLAIAFSTDQRSPTKT
ncbi:MAG: hypothetical protein ACAF41_31440 [Leptolyngbya sp. BL-A-14]